MLSYANIFGCLRRKGSRKNKDSNGTNSEAHSEDYAMATLSEKCVESGETHDRRTKSEPSLATRRSHGSVEPPRKASSCSRLSYASPEEQQRQRLADIQRLENYMRRLRQTASDDMMPVLPSRLCCAQLLQTALWRRERQYVKEVLHGRIQGRRQNSDFGTTAKNASSSNNDKSINAENNMKRLRQESGSIESLSSTKSATYSVSSDSSTKSASNSIGTDASSDVTRRVSWSLHDELRGEDSYPEVDSDTGDDDKEEEVQPSTALGFMNNYNNDWLTAFRSRSDLGVPAYLLPVY